jgi:hypothetical protein
MSRRGRIEFGPLAAAAGAVLLLVSLFLVWYGGGVTAWEAFEVLDLVLAALALISIAHAAEALGVPIPVQVERREALAICGVFAVVLVLSQVLNHPPAAVGRDAQTGQWLGLAGAGLMLVGGGLSLAWFGRLP